MSMKPRPPLSPIEWQVMASVWSLGEADALRVSNLLRERRRNCPPKTAGVYLARLEDKGYLRSEPTQESAGRGRPAHVYFPLVSREKALAAQLERFLDEHPLQDGEVQILQDLLRERA
jgi:predicted transcriptional regulator